MTDGVYCYHCRSYHRPHEVMLVPTARGKRWRCRKSSLFGRRSQAQRDAFGKTVSEMNRIINGSLSERSLPRPVLEAIRHSFCGR